MPPRHLIDAIASRIARPLGRTAHIPLCLLMLSCFATTSGAQQATDPMETCYQLSDPGAQLRCFKQEMERRHAASRGTGIAPVTPAAKAAAPATAPTSAAPTSAAAAPVSKATPSTTATTGVPTATHTPPDDTIGLDGRQLRDKRRAEGIEPPTVKPIVAALTQLKSRPGHQYFFELDNGQVWESTDTEPDLFPGPHETVTIRPGLFGAFFLKTQAGRSIRVHRLR